MKKDLFDIIREKSFEELTTAERAEVSEMASDAEAYTELQGFMDEVDSVASEKIVPSAKVKGDLDDLFDQVHGQRKYAWYLSFAAVLVPREKPLYQQPLFYAAAVLLLALLVVPFAYNNLSNTPDVLAQNEVVQEESLFMEEENVAVEVPVSTNVETRSLNEQAKSEVVMEDANRADGMRPVELAFAEAEEKVEEELSAVEFDMSVTSAPSVSIAATTVERHPDGVFEDWATESNFSVPASKQPELLDLLTATF
ncbi:MAG: hypothetical protein ACO2Z9_02670 [Crocinitomicaceae bacterium]